jgi:hypothetical protein
MAPTIRDQFHPILRGLLPSFFDTESFVESKATCDNCVMLAPEGLAKTQARDFFHPDTKCCTYHPRMPNFLVGAILADASPEGAEGIRRVRALIAGRTGVTPEFLGPSRKYNVLLDAGRVNGFGRSLRMRCPYFHEEHKNCTIWRYRKSDCAVFYCKYDAGADGQAYWRGVGAYWHRLEMRTAALVRERVSTEVEQPPWRLDRMSIEELEDRPPDPRSYSAWWGPYEGHEEAFYQACFEEATRLTDEDAEQLLGDEQAKHRLSVVKSTHEQLANPTFPERLTVNPELEAVDGPEGVKLVVSYSRYEPMALPRVIYDLLPKFDGSATVAEVQKRILDEDGADFADGLVLTMYQQRILVPAEPGHE